MYTYVHTYLYRSDRTRQRAYQVRVGNPNSILRYQLNKALHFTYVCRHIFLIPLPGFLGTYPFRNTYSTTSLHPNSSYVKTTYLTNSPLLSPTFSTHPPFLSINPLSSPSSHPSHPFLLFLPAPISSLRHTTTPLRFLESSLSLSPCSTSRTSLYRILLLATLDTGSLAIIKETKNYN